MVARDMLEDSPKPIEAKHVEEYVYEVEVREHVGEERPRMGDGAEPRGGHCQCGVDETWPYHAHQSHDEKNGYIDVNKTNNCTVLAKRIFYF